MLFQHLIIKDWGEKKKKSAKLTGSRWSVTHVGFLNEFLFGDLAYAVQVWAVTAGHRRHISPANLRDKEKLVRKLGAHNWHISCLLQSPLKRTAGLKHCSSTTTSDRW